MTRAPSTKLVRVTAILAALCFGLNITVLGGGLLRDFSVNKLDHVACNSNSESWWECPRSSGTREKTFNKSILYLKPHKTGSETFKEILWRISDHYGLTAERTVGLSPKKRIEIMAKSRYDITTDHAEYREGESERRLRGWDEGEFEAGGKGEPAKRKFIKIVTIRSPVDRVFSHYFSQLRHKNYTPARGLVKKGLLSEEEELSDFLEWLERYPSNQLVRYLMDTPAESEDLSENTVMLQRVKKIVGYYDHVIVVDQWKQSLCLFGFLEKVEPRLLQLKKRNENTDDVKRFDVSVALQNPSIFGKVLSKINMDFVLYSELFKKYSRKLDEEASADLQRYCARVASEQSDEAYQGKIQVIPEAY